MPARTIRWSRLVLALVLASSACGTRPPLPPEALESKVLRADVVPILVDSNSVTLKRIPTLRETIVESLHGRRIPDPYRWLENGDDPRVIAWVAAQNQLTRKTLAGIPGRANLKRRLGQLLEIGQVSLPSVRRIRPGYSRYFYTRREGQQNQPVLLVRDGLDGKDRVLFDPNALSSEGTLALDWYAPSNEGKLIAYGTSAGGSEESTLYVRDVRQNTDLSDVITRTRAASVCWMPGSQRFFYSRYPKAGSVPSGEEKYHRKIYEHVLGRNPDQDRVVFGAGRAMTDFPSCDISPDGRWLVVRVHEGWSKSEVFVADTRAAELTFSEITERKDHLYNPIVENDALYIHTNEGAPRYALYAVDPRKPARDNWRLVVREHTSDVLDSVDVIGKNVLATYSHEAVSRLERFDEHGKSLGAIALPTVGTSDGFSGLSDGDEAFFNFESFALPPSIRRLDLNTAEVSVWQDVKSPLKPDEFAVTARKARSKDGTLVPYLMVHKKALDLDSGSNPTLLYGYGGFNVSLQPRFSRTNCALIEQGAVYVQANLRGGGEFGENWHRAGQLDKKQNVFDDVIAVAEDLLARRVTRPGRLAIHGRSNGGLLVAAALTQRPDLFRVAVSTVPLTDMLRYQRFLIAKLWVPEYGSAEDARQFEVLYRYSPYHRVKPGTAYPAIMFTTAVSDTRVDPMHARKMTAALQHATSSDRPILLRTETQAGHGAGKPMQKVADEYADIFSFILWQLGVLAGLGESE